MADGDAPKSPPLPKRGTYDIDFDSLDDSVNPFESKVKLGSSPPIQSSSSYSFDADAIDDIDPFKPRKAVANSPVGSPKSKSPLQNFSNNNNNNNGPIGLEASQPEDNLSSPRQDESAKEACSKASPKKKRVLKKPKGQSKIKPPRNLKPSDSVNDEIQIFVPGESSNVPAADGGDTSLPQHQGDNAVTEPQHDNTLSEPLLKDEELPPPPPELLAVDDSGVEKKERPSSLEEEVPYDPAPEAMVSSSEMDTQFVNADDVDDLCQEFSQSKKKDTSKNTQDDVKMKAREPQTIIENEESDINTQEKVTKTSGSQQQELSPEQHPSDDGSPAVKKSPRAQQQQQQAGGESGGLDKHPAARVLEANVADDSRKAADPKNESSSELEENTFYDAEEYPPTTSAASFGQKSNSGVGAMQQRTPSPSTDGNTGKQQGTMVQLVQVLRYSQSDWNKLRQELELGFQAQLLTKEREWSALLGERDKRLEQAEDTNKRLRQTCEDMRSVVAEFEKTISQLQADKERHKKDLNKTTSELENERDQAIEDLQSVESAFSDLHRRYEKSKGIIEGFKKNEEQLKQHVEELQAKLVKSEAKLQSLRSQAEEKLDRANEDIEQIKKSTKSEVARLEAALKKSEIRICTLDESLQRKEKENQELTAICDELIAKVGS